MLDRLENDSASKRLLGVIEASDLAGRDPEVTRALLERAVDDRVHSVRSAAIDAIGPRLGTPAVGDELMASLEKAESPLVQLALADLVLRYGNPNQLEQLLGSATAACCIPTSPSTSKSSVSRNPRMNKQAELAMLGLIALLACDSARRQRSPTRRRGRRIFR